jgi:hypothetical protein
MGKQLPDARDYQDSPTLPTNVHGLALIDDDFLAPEILERIRKHVREPFDKQTPKDFIHKMGEKKGDIRFEDMEYPDFAYMVSEMDRLHPLRSEQVTYEIHENVGVISATAIVTDLITHEVRTGGDAHRIALKKASRGETKKIEDIIDVGNDVKSAMTEALRNVYSRFGICADVYGKNLREPVTPDQRYKFQQLMLDIDEFKQLLPDIKDSIDSWQEGLNKGWSTQIRSTAGNWLEKLEKLIQEKKQKYNIGDNTNG